MGLLTLIRPLKNLNFTNPRWRTTAILKTVKLPYLCNRFTDFDEIWHGDAHSALTGDRPLKFQFLKIQDGGGRHHKNHHISATVWPIFTKFGTLMQNWLLTTPTVKKFEFHKSKTADGHNVHCRPASHILVCTLFGEW